MSRPIANQENEPFTASSEAVNEKSRLTLAAGQVTGQMFCGYHQGYADLSTGKHIMRNRTKKFMCGPCMKLRGIQH